jgi:hypothetical protein
MQGTGSDWYAPHSHMRKSLWDTRNSVPEPYPNYMPQPRAVSVNQIGGMQPSRIPTIPYLPFEERPHQVLPKDPLQAPDRMSGRPA